MNSFGAKSALTAGNTKYEYYSLEQAEKSGAGSLANLPFSLKVMLENLLRFEDGSTVTTDDVRSVATSITADALEKEIAFRPARVLMQDFTGVPAVVDLATMRDVIRKMGGDPKKNQSSSTGRPRDRSLGTSRPIWNSASIRVQRGSRT